MHARADDIVAKATELQGTRYKHVGRTLNGLDCAGLLVYVAKDLGISDFDSIAYSRRPNVKEFTAAMVSAGCRRLRHSEREHGDILRFSIEGWPVHVGIYEVDQKGQEWVTHAYLPHKQVTRERLRPELEKAISTVWRFPE